MKHGLSRSILALVGSAAVAGCTAEYTDYAADTDYEADTEVELGSTAQSITTCGGDGNAFAASLAVAIANELGRWDVNADFEVRNGKLELSTTGQMRCNGGCGNTIALLRLQDDAASAVPNHNPSAYRSKLAAWYQKQTQKLTTLVNEMLTVDKGIYKFKARHSGKYMAVDNGSTSDGALVEQRSSVSETGADQWRLVLEGTKHKLKNVRSGKCLAMSTDSTSNNINLVQKTCSTSALQGFEFAQNYEYIAIRTKSSLAVDVSAASQSNDARVVQNSWNGASQSQQWTLEPVGTGVHIGPKIVATAMYVLKAGHSGKALGVDNGSMLDGALIEQSTYSASDDRFHWYITQSGTHFYQFVNRRSGKCMGLLSDTSTSRLAQKTCSSAADQYFAFNPTGSGHQVVYTKFGRTLEVEGASTSNDARLTQGDSNWYGHKTFSMTPILAGEPHRLTFSHITNDAACGDYYWYEISQPNTAALRAPEDSFVQLIFAGGKETLTGADINPFIAQRVSGDLVAIDPTYGLNEGSSSSAGSCSAACAKYSSNSVAGQCCTCNGATKKYVRSTFSTSMYLCTG